MDHLLNILLLVIIIFLPIVSYIIYSQRENQLQKEGVIKLRISFSSYISIVMMFFMTYLSLVFLYLAYFCFFVIFSIENMFLGFVYIIISLFFLIPVLNIGGHYLKESRKEIYFFKARKTLLIVEKDIETVFDLENQELKIIHLRPKKVLRNPSGYGKYLFILDDNVIEISDMINFPDNIFEGSNFTATKGKSLFIWI